MITTPSGKTLTLNELENKIGSFLNNEKNLITDPAFDCDTVKGLIDEILTLRSQLIVKGMNESKG